MKKLLLVMGVFAFIAGFTSCSKYTDCKCTYTVLGEEVTHTYTADEMENMEKTCSDWEQEQQSLYTDIDCRKSF